MKLPTRRFDADDAPRLVCRDAQRILRVPLRSTLRDGEEECFDPLRLGRQLLDASEEKEIRRDDIGCRVPAENHAHPVDVELAR